MRHSFLLVGCLLSIVGCAAEFDLPDGEDGSRVPIPSDGVRTQELGASIVVSGRDDGASDAFVFLRGHDRNVELVAPDALSASIGDARATLDPTSFESADRTVSYRARLAALGGRATVTLSRGAEMLESSVELPEPFALRLESGTMFSRRTDDVVLRWDPSSVADRMYWYAAGKCIAVRKNTDVPDTGTLLIPRSSWTEGASAGDCDVTIYLRRSRNGSLARGFGGGGGIQGEQVRTVTLSSRP